MSDEACCPNCGARVDRGRLAGLCPQCLLGRGLALDAVAVPDDPRADGPAGGDRYSVLAEHGRGGMGRVLRVRDHQLDRDVALKELLPQASAAVSSATPEIAARAKDLVSRLVREARITGQLEHPGITPVHELGWREDGTPFYTMKLVRGRTLAVAIAEAGSLARRLELLPHFVDLCQAMAYAHARGVVHRDLKPQNVMIGEYGETVVLDWGLARQRTGEDPRASEVAETLELLRDGREADAGATAYGQALGTPAYMPPEQALGRLEEVDERSDVYALGAVLYHLLTGRPPFVDGSLAELLRCAIAEAPPEIRAVEPGTPVELGEICERAMAKDRRHRYATARLLAEHVAGYVPRPFYWNPFRPSLDELVPALGALRPRDQRAVVNAARRRAMRDWRFPVFGIAGSALVLLFCLLGTMVPMVLDLTIELAEQLRAEEQYSSSLRLALAAAAERGLRVPVVASVDVEPPQLVSLLVWPARHAKGVGLAFVVAGCLLAYVYQRFFNEWWRQRLLPHVRQILAEQTSSSAP